MAVFRFRLQKVLELREREEESARLRLAAAQREHQQAEAALAQAREARAAFDRQCAEDPQRPLTALDLRARLSTANALAAVEEQATRTCSATTAKVERERLHAVDAHRKVQVLQRLRERAHRRWLVEMSTQERKALDDIRNRNGESGLLGSAHPTRSQG